MTSIREALDELLSDQSADFVLIEVEGTDQFVQVARLEDRLVLDLPLPALTGDEFDRAEAFFFRTGGTLRPWADVVEGGDRSYRVDLGQDTARGEQVAEGVFREIYGVDETARLIVRLEKRV